MMTLSLACIVCFTIACQQQNPESWSLASPDGKVKVTVFRGMVGDPYPERDDGLVYTVELNGAIVVQESPLGVWMQGDAGDFVNGLRYVDEDAREINESYPMPSGKKSLHVNHCNEMTLSFVNARNRPMDIIFRAYDEGAAFRYCFSGNGEKKTIVGEESGFKIPLGSEGWCMRWTYGYDLYYERGIVGWKFLKGQGPRQGFWPLLMNGDTLDEIAFPALFRTPAGQWVLLTEAAVYADYCCCRLAGGYRVAGIFQIALDHEYRTTTSTLPWETPWRVVIAGETLKPIVETVMIENLNPPSEFTDFSWIKPGKVTWTWWYKDVDDPTDLNPHFNAFAREMGWYETHQVRGARVPVLLKMSWDEIDQYLREFKEKGGLGIKIDFFDSDSQERMKWYDSLAVMTARHKIMVNLTGSTIPRGQRRRWPHLIANESVRGAEFYKFAETDPPDPVHNCTLPYLRNNIGPMDYTGVTFSGPASRPLRKTSNAHELAMSLVYENGFRYWGDSPESYRSIPAAMSYLKKVPVAWDDIHYIEGFPGEYCCISRRKGQEWYFGAISAGSPTQGGDGWYRFQDGAQNRTVPLDFLEPGVQYQMVLHKDGVHKDKIDTERATVNSETVLNIRVIEDGGFCGVLSPVGG